MSEPMMLTAPNALCFSLLWKQHLWFGLIGLLGAGWLWFALSRHGIGLSPDSAGYLAVAQNLLEGKGFLSYRGEPFVSQPPLYPLAIATVSFFFSFAPTTSALLINVFLFAAVTHLSGRLAFLITKSFPISIAVCFSVISGVPVTWVSIFAWSEILFIFFIIASIISMLLFISSKNIRDLLACSLLVGCSCMTRYAGLFFIISFLLFMILLPDEKLGKKLYYLSTFLSISLFPITIWILRNYILSETLFGPRTGALLKAYELTLLLCDTFVSWFVPPIFILKNEISLFILFNFLAFAFLFICKSQVKNLNSLFVITLIFLYPILIFTSSLRFAYDPIDHRLLSPVFVPLIIILLNFPYQTFHLYLKSRLSKRVQSVLIILGGLVWFTHPALSTLILGLEVRQEGKGYHAVHWQTSETLAYVRQVGKQLTRLPIYTNDPEGLYFLAHIQAEHLPFHPRPTWPETGRAYLIRFKPAYRGECLDIIEGLRHSADIRLLAHFSDGEIYLVTHKSLQVSSH